MAFKNIIVEKSGNVTTLSIDRQDKLNAMDAETRTEMVQVLNGLKQDRTTKCLILTGSGDRAFSAGQDLSETKEFRGDSADEWIRQWDELYLAIIDVPQIVVTSTPGYAVGAGWQIYLLGDYRISSENGKFGMNEINDGIACITGAAILKSMIGLANAKKLTITGDLIDAKEALSLGLVNKVVRQSDLKKSANEIATRLAEKPSIAVKLQREWFKKLIMDDLAEAFEQARISQGEAFASGEPQQLMRAFLQRKRN